jgi:phosphonate transport system substrate-binding protein
MRLAKEKKSTLFTILLIIIITFLSCGKYSDEKVINLEEKESIKEGRNVSKDESLRIAVGGMITPREGFSYYKRLLDYIGEKLGKYVDFVDREDYAEINRLLKSGNIDVAFVCGGPYVDGHEDFGLELLVAPVINGKTVYYSYIIVNRNSDIKEIEDLRGKIFAFTDPLSNTGELVPTYMLSKMNETPDTFFKKCVFTYAHDRSIEAVAQKLVDGAAVDSLIWEYLNKVNPKLTSETRIIKRSPPYGIPPVVVRPDLDPELKKRIKDIFLNIHRDKEGQKILEGMMIEKFVQIDDSAYDSIRAMKNWLKESLHGE